MTPGLVFHLALCVYAIGLVSLVGGGAILFHAYTEDLDADVAETSLPIPRSDARSSRQALGSRGVYQRPRLNFVPSRPGYDATHAGWTYRRGPTDS